jgi:hypothetical protein
MPVRDLSAVLDEAGVRHELLSHARTESHRRGGTLGSPSRADVANTLVVNDASDARLGADRPSRHATSQKRHEGPPRCRA